MIERKVLILEVSDIAKLKAGEVILIGDSIELCMAIKRKHKIADEAPGNNNTKGKTIREEILEALRSANGPLRKSEIAHALPHRKHTSVYSVIDSHVENGTISRGEKYRMNNGKIARKYQLTEKGASITNGKK